MIVFFFLLSFFPLQSEFNGWKTLEQLDLKVQNDPFLGEEIEIPIFHEELKQYDGTEIKLEGFVIPLETNTLKKYFALSRFPYNNCFFCGNAGPETVAEVYAQESMTIFDQKVRVKGRLKLNDSDPLHLFFLITDAEVTILD